MAWLFRSAGPASPQHLCNLPMRQGLLQNGRRAAAGDEGDIWQCDVPSCRLLSEVVRGFDGVLEWRTARSLWARSRLNSRVNKLRRDGLL